MAQHSHCHRGHEFTPENTIIEKGGHRKCRTCRQMRERKRTEDVRSARTETEQKCCICGYWKPHSAFGTVVRYRSGKPVIARKYQCQDCCNARQRKYEATRRQKKRAERAEFLTGYRETCAWFFDRYLDLWYEGASDTTLAERLGVSPLAALRWMRGQAHPNPKRLVKLVSLIEETRTWWRSRPRTASERMLARMRAKNPSRTNPLTRADRQAA